MFIWYDYFLRSQSPAKKIVEISAVKSNEPPTLKKFVQF